MSHLANRLALHTDRINTNFCDEHFMVKWVLEMDFELFFTSAVVPKRLYLSQVNLVHERVTHLTNSKFFSPDGITLHVTLKEDDFHKENSERNQICL